MDEGENTADHGSGTSRTSSVPLMAPEVPLVAPIIYTKNDPVRSPKLTTNAKSVRCKSELCVNKAVRGGIPGLCRTHGGGKRCEAAKDPLIPVAEGGEKCGQSAKEGGFCIKHGLKNEV